METSRQTSSGYGRLCRNRIRSTESTDSPGFGRGFILSFAQPSLHVVARMAEQNITAEGDSPP
ncbi:hypothetical protein [Haladaptatus halobius]|uniref:hypothetical protein n=1 Tax=Haladaptatus halobius TaxID=2884875 RepID=UPI001D0B51F6|nr:hypothetical protein [Haladaptatus halobius]